MQNDITALSNYYETQLNKYIEANGDLQKINV